MDFFTLVSGNVTGNYLRASESFGFGTQLTGPARSGL